MNNLYPDNLLLKVTAERHPERDEFVFTVVWRLRNGELFSEAITAKEFDQFAMEIQEGIHD